MTLWKWSKTATNNANSDATINWAENQAPSSVNNSARAEMAAVAKARDDWSGMLNTGGSATAYTLTSNQNLTTLTDGFRIAARVHAASGASPTLAVDGLTAKAIRTHTSTALPTGALNSGGIYIFTYDSGDDCWYVHGYFALNADTLGLGTGDSPQFAGINLGHASDTTLSRASAGDINVEGNLIYRAGGTDVPITDGGTGASSAATAFSNLKQAASDSATGVIEIADQSEQETATATDKAVTPGRQHFHPGHPKFWARVNVSGGTPSLAASYNVTGIIDSGTGLLTVTIATDFSSANWCCLASVEFAGGNTTVVNMDTGDINAGSVQLRAQNTGSSGSSFETDPPSYHVMGMGDHS